MKKRKGQNIAEYSILITLIIIAAVGMQTYVKRGLSGRVKDAVDFTQFTDFENGRLAEKTTDFFYKEIAQPFINNLKQEIKLKSMVMWPRKP